MSELFRVFSKNLRIVDVLIATVWGLNMSAQISGHLFAPPVVEYTGSSHTELNQYRWLNLLLKKSVLFRKGEISYKVSESNFVTSNVERLQDFIKHVYVDGRYSGGRSNDKTPQGKTGDKEDFFENRRTNGYQGGSRSPQYEDTHERRYSERSSPGGTSDDRSSRYGYDEKQSLGYNPENRKYAEYVRSPARPEIMNNWRREDRFGNGKKFEDRKISKGDPKLEGRLPERQKDLESSSPPVVRPIREIMGENVISLRINDPLNTNGGRTGNGPQAQRNASSGSLRSTSGNLAKVKLETTGSLIDFDADPEPLVASAVPQTQQTTVAQSIVQPASSTNENNWASFDFAPQTNVSQAPSSVDTLEFVLSSCQFQHLYLVTYQDHLAVLVIR
ncbi:hypothetical protein J1N35_032683 [Gossypium stocksii]|uniref:Uncharacterized protein n=1 Tax=Gossypium stocksii TaxID=47602 RepID=A0A9D3V3V6_9ROSI|nr:hypothetical protein J1N35_032683 [Gossypium stocksii]